MNRADRETLIGKYCFNRFGKNSSKDSLFINRDSSYKHVYWVSGSRTFEASGKWIYDSIQQEILFKKFMFFNDSGSEMPAGNWFSRINVTGDGEVRLMYSEENNVYFVKVR